MYEIIENSKGSDKSLTRFHQSNTAREQEITNSKKCQRK